METINFDPYSFDAWWNLYDKKVGKEPCIKKYAGLSLCDKKKIFETLPTYVLYTPEKQYRLNPQTYLNQKAWENELIDRRPKQTVIKTNPADNGSFEDAATRIINRHMG